VTATPDFYALLVGDPDPARAAGWEHPLGQAARFEAALAPVRPGDAVLDLGCGPAALFPYLAARVPGARYVGVDRLPAMLARARAAHPTADLRLADALGAAPLPEADVVVAVGTLVDGHPVANDAARFARLRALAARALGAARRAAVLVVLDQDHVDARLMLKAEPALAGARAAEGPWLARALGVDVDVQRVLTSDLALTLWRPDAPRPETSPVDYAARALAGPAGADARPEDIAWLWYAAGDYPRARLALDGAEDSWRVRWLRDALAAAP